MTRINLVPPRELCDKHLIAEWRELVRIPRNLIKGKCKIESIPEQYTLGEGHVKFFYNKLAFLKTRYNALFMECKRRGFNVHYFFPNQKDLSILPPELFGCYEPTEQALELNRHRIAERMPRNAKFTKHG